MANPARHLFSREVLIGLAVLTITAVLAIVARELVRQKPAAPAAPMMDEQCLYCHLQKKDDPGGAHEAGVMGCSSCHLGNPDTRDKERAHRHMVSTPGALENAARTCGTPRCHPETARHIKTALMTTASGIIGVNKMAFGEQDHPDTRQTMTQTMAKGDPETSDGHLRKLCAGCHLGSGRDNRDDAIDETAGVGCGACHYRSPTDPEATHAPITRAVSDDACFGCHSRSGRIALSYRGLAEISDLADPLCATTGQLPDGRTVCQVPADVHFLKGLQCIDCHLHTEMMGDGTAHRHKEEQVSIRCRSCHGPNRDAQPIGISGDQVIKRIRHANGLPNDPAQRTLVSDDHTPIWNSRRTKTGKWRLWAKIPKSGFKRAAWTLTDTPQNPDHNLPGHERLSCQSCHSTRMPTCETCHTLFVPDKTQYDFAKGKPTPGAWVEEASRFTFVAPMLAVRSNKTIIPVVPGMNMTISLGDGAKHKVHLISSLAPHTTQKASRSCHSCHNHAAVAFNEATLPRATRKNIRPLSSEEVDRVVGVGPCLKCHEKATDPIYRNFSTAIANPCAPGRHQAEKQEL